MKQLTRSRSGNWDNCSDRRRSVRTIDETELNRLTPLESFSLLISLFETHRVSQAGCHSFLAYWSRAQFQTWTRKFLTIQFTNSAHERPLSRGLHRSQSIVCAQRGSKRTLGRL